MRAVVALLVALPGLAAAEPGAILFAAKGTLNARASDGTITTLVALPTDLGTLRALETSPSARLIVLDYGDKQAWAVQMDGAWVVRTGACTGRARPSPTDECVVCPAGERVIMQATTADVSIPLPYSLIDPAFRGQSGLDLVGTIDGQVVGIDRRKPRVVDVLTDEGPRTHVIVAPDGQQAIALFGEGDGSRFRTFFLDGRGISRQLGGPGVPRAWSPDSRWVLVQEGILDGEEDGDDDGGEGSLFVPTSVIGFPGELAFRPPPRRKTRRRRPTDRAPVILAAPARTRACVARATGGEVKCWPDFEGLAISPDSMSVLLKKGDVLYLGEVPGVRPTPPKKLLDGVDGPATWSAGTGSSP